MILQNDINRFLSAQEFTYSIALNEIIQGKKKTHWMWFIFPQLAGLGASAPAQIYGIRDAEEAKEYMSHPVLGKRLVEITKAVLKHKSKRAEEIFGFPDVLKFQSCMTLFWLVSGDTLFKEALECFYNGELCEYTEKKVVQKI